MAARKPPDASGSPAPRKPAKPRKPVVPEGSAPEPADDGLAALRAAAAGFRAFATMHPSWVLRQRDSESRVKAYGNFTDDLSLLLDA